MNRDKIEIMIKFFHHIFKLILLFTWFIMMFQTNYVLTTEFKLFSSIQFYCVLIYSYLRNKYSPQLSYSKFEKCIFIILFIALIIRFCVHFA